MVGVDEDGRSMLTITTCQSARVVGHSCGGREAGDSAPGGGEDATPSWRPASSKRKSKTETGEEREP